MKEHLVLECISCEVEGFCPRIILGEGADVFGAEGDPAAFLIFIGAHSGYPGHWDPQKHHLRLRLGDQKIHPSEVRSVFPQLPWLVERLAGSYPTPSIQGIVEFN